jgi:hypothetical protein
MPSGCGRTPTSSRCITTFRRRGARKAALPVRSNRRRYFRSAAAPRRPRDLRETPAGQVNRSANRPPILIDAASANIHSAATTTCAIPPPSLPPAGRSLVLMNHASNVHLLARRQPRGSRNAKLQERTESEFGHLNCRLQPKPAHGLTPPPALSSPRPAPS